MNEVQLAPFDSAQRPIVGNFNLQVALGKENPKTLSIAGYFYEGEDAQALSSRLDLAFEVSHRQELKMKIEELRATIKQAEEAKAQIGIMVAELESKSKLTSQERNTLNTQRLNLKHLASRVETTQEAIAVAQKAVA
jgi:actin-related protein